MQATLEPGTYSHGSLTNEDTHDMFDTIAIVTGCNWCIAETNVLGRNLDHAERYPDDERYAEDISESIGYLFDHVQEHHAPKGFYFGSIEGDASDFGIWKDQVMV